MPFSFKLKHSLQIVGQQKKKKKERNGKYLDFVITLEILKFPSFFDQISCVLIFMLSKKANENTFHHDVT